MKLSVIGNIMLILILLYFATGLVINIYKLYKIFKEEDEE